MLTQKPWRAEAVIQLIAGVFACLCVGVLLAGVLQKAGMPAFKKEDSLANILLATLSFQGATWVLILVFLKQHGANWRAAFGFRNTNLTKSLLLAAGVRGLGSALNDRSSSLHQVTSVVGTLVSGTFLYAIV